MPYIENETKSKIRKIRNSVEPVLNGFTNKLEYFEVKKDDFYWIVDQLEKLEKYESALNKIAAANNNISRASCPSIAKDALYNKEES